MFEISHEQEMFAPYWTTQSKILFNARVLIRFQPDLTVENQKQRLIHPFTALELDRRKRLVSYFKWPHRFFFSSPSQTFYFSHFYAVADSDDNHESIRLGLLFQEEGDMRLVDEGYITLTYNDPIPEAGFLISMR